MLEGQTRCWRCHGFEGERPSRTALDWGHFFSWLQCAGNGLGQLPKGQAVGGDQ